MRRTCKPRWLLLALLWVAGLQPADAAIELLDDRGQKLRLEQPAQRVVSLLPSLSEMVCALQACDRLVGTDRFSNWPAQAAAAPKLGGLEDTQIERIVRLQPDLVLVALSTRVTDRLQALGLRVLALEPRTLADTQRVLRLLALALGQPGQGDVVWAGIERRIAAAAARVPPGLRGKRVYFEVSSAPYAAGQASFVGEMLTRLGLGNVVPAAMGPFPQLSPEFVLRAQPDLVMASARYLAEMAKRPGWSALPALRQQRTCGFSETQNDMLVRAGPRLADAAEVIADCLVNLDRGYRGDRGDSGDRSARPGGR